MGVPLWVAFFAAIFLCLRCAAAKKGFPLQPLTQAQTAGGGLIGKYNPKLTPREITTQIIVIKVLIRCLPYCTRNRNVYFCTNLKLKKMKKLFVLAFMIAAPVAFAQDMDVVKGDFGFLTGQKDINVEFDYSKMTLMKEKKSEAQYIEDRAADLNGKARGNGEIWKKKWEGAKDGIWQPKFLELVNTILTKGKKEASFQEGLKDAKYTMIVEVVWVFPGWDVSVMKQAAKVSTNLKFVETANKSNVLLEISSENAPGDQWGSQFSNETRIGEGFAKTGKSLGQMLVKKAYKK
jgi:hypothetical protein